MTRATRCVLIIVQHIIIFIHYVLNSPHKDGPTDAEFPSCESLKLTIERTLPYWNEVIVPQLKVGKIKTYMHTQSGNLP